MIIEIYLINKTCSILHASFMFPLQAVYARDALCKAIYSRLFSWLVQRINDSIKVRSDNITVRRKCMGVLDIYGFEVFEVSSGYANVLICKP